MILSDRADVLDDLDELERADPGGMVRDVAGAPAQLREAAFTAAEVDLEPLLEGLRPRAVVVVGIGASAMAGDVLGAVAGLSAPVPVLTHRGFGLPGWVGAADLVLAVSCSGREPETLDAAEEAARRAVPLVGVGPGGSPLLELVLSARGPVFPVVAARTPRAGIWALAAPLLVVANRLGICRVDARTLGDAADVLDDWTQRCKPAKESFLNPAKDLALTLADRLPVVWGTSSLAGVAARRFTCQLAENARMPAIAGVLPEANHNQLVAVDDTAADDNLAVVLLRDAVEHPEVARRADASRLLAEDRGIPVRELLAEGDSPLSRLASLIAVGDFASAYAGVLRGFDPSRDDVITELKGRVAE